MWKAIGAFPDPGGGHLGSPTASACASGAEGGKLVPASSRQCHAEGRGGTGKQGPGRSSLESNGAGPQPPAQPCSLLQHFRAQNPGQGSERHSSGQADPRASSVPHSGLLDGADHPHGVRVGDVVSGAAFCASLRRNLCCLPAPSS